MIKLTGIKDKSGFINILIRYVICIMLFFVLIMGLRGVMNAISRTDFVSQRLDDYPRLYDNYTKENDDYWNWWLTQDYDKRARQAAFIFSEDESFTDEDEKLEYIAGTVGADRAQILLPSEFDEINASNDTAGFDTCFEKLPDGRIIVLTIRSQQDEAWDRHSFLRQLQAGLEGYVLVLHEGELDIYPEDNESNKVMTMVSDMLSSGELVPEKQVQEAAGSGLQNTVKFSMNTATGGIPARKYALYTAAYTDNPDYVINVVPISEVFRFGKKRSWSLWFLCAAASVLMGIYLNRLRIYDREDENLKAGDRLKRAYRRGFVILFTGSVLIFFSVVVTQMLSDVNVSEDAVAEEAGYLKYVLQQESDRAETIQNEFNNMYKERVNTAASVLSRNPQLQDMDSIHSLEAVLGGNGMRLLDTQGKPELSCESLHPSGEKPDGEPLKYTAVMTDDKGRTTGIVELLADRKLLDTLLTETRLEEILGDLHILDSLHVVAVDANKQIITGSSYKNWVGDSALEHGIDAQFFYDGYEGIVNFDGSKCYSVVFAYDNGFVVVGSEDTTALVFISGVLILSLSLILVLVLALYRPLVRHCYRVQKNEFPGSTAACEIPGTDSIQDYPAIWDMIRKFMLAVFLLSLILYFSTKIDPTGITYNIVRGVWSRGISPVTITTCIMLASVVFAVQELLDFIYRKLKDRISPKGRTICRLIDSGCAYLGAIIIILYTLSMFGVNTSTLIGGVGAAALVITFGANSLIADVIAGLFIIFEGDFTVGDVVVIDDFRGIVTDISMRTTKLMDDNTKDILIVNNSNIKDMVNQSREQSLVTLDIPIRNSDEFEKKEQYIRDTISSLPEKYPQIIGQPEYWGLSKMPSRNSYTGNLSGGEARIAFSCLEGDREMLTYKIQRELLEMVSELNKKTE